MHGAEVSAFLAAGHTMEFGGLISTSNTFAFADGDPHVVHVDTSDALLWTVQVSFC
jgi:hypothetical protein